MNNTIRRSISGTCFIILMLAGLLINKYFYAALILFIMIVMMCEFYRMTMGRQYIFSRILAILTGVILFALMFSAYAYGLPVRLVSLTILPVIIVMVNSLYVKDKTEFWKFSHIYTGLLYIGVPLSLSNIVVFHGHSFNGILMLCFFIIIWASDVGGYVFGITLGKIFTRKLFPSVSPKKSWAGFWGGMVLAVSSSLILRLIGWFEFPIVHCIMLAVVMDVAGVYGDLFESQWKRCYDLKDSGNIIPGHGGMLDRFDSTLFAVPIGVLYMVLCNLI